MSSRTDLSAIVFGGSGAGYGAFRQYIHVADTDGMHATTVRQIYDGDGTATDLWLATNKVKVAQNFYIGAAGVAIDTILDEDAMGSNDANALATQQSIKAYVDAVAAPTTLAALTDTIITSVANGEVLMWSGGADWINRTLAEASISATGHTHTETDITDLGAYIEDITGESIDDLSDADITGINDNEILVWETNTLTPQTPSEWLDGQAISTLTSLTVDNITINGSTISATGDITIDSTGAGVNINTDTGAGDDFAVNTSMLVVKGDTGKVGIGTTGPDLPLGFKGEVGGKINFYDGAVYDIGVQANLMEFFGGSSNIDFTFGYGTSGSLTKIMTIQGTGEVGIGTVTPLSTLSINGSLHVGGDSDAGDNNLLVDGTVIIGSDLRYPILGYATGESVLRSLKLVIENATTAGDYIKVTGTNLFNASAIAVEDDIFLGTPGVRFNYDQAYRFLIQSGALDGTPIAVLSAWIARNYSGISITVSPEIIGASIRLSFWLDGTGGATDLDLLVDTGNIEIYITYLTSS